MVRRELHADPPLTGRVDDAVELVVLTVHGVDLLTWNAGGPFTDFTVMVRPFKGLQKLMELMPAELRR